MADGDKQLIETDPANPLPLGRHVNHDPRNRLHRALDVPMAEVPARTRPWETSWIGDQGIVPSLPVPADLRDAGLREWPTGTCTTYTAVGLARTYPFRGAFSTRHWRRYDTAEERIRFYLISQGVDPWDGSELVDPRYEGSSSDAPARVLRDRGHIPGWTWLFGADEVRHHLMHRGPIGAGTVWLDRMFRPDSEGTIDVSGREVGGHEYRLTYYDLKKRRYLTVGSWGRQWGGTPEYGPGTAWFPEEKFDGLLANQGDAWTISPA